MESVWNEVKMPSFPSLDGDEKTDVLVIGGGMCGILCAYMLKCAGVNCVLVDSGKICGGVSSGTTAKITVQHGLIYSKIFDKYGIEKAALYYRSQKEAFDLLIRLADKENCDLEYCDSYVYSLHDKDAIEREKLVLDKIGCKTEFSTDTELPLKIAGAIGFSNQAMFHPLKFANALSRGLRIYENTKVTQIRNNMAITDNGKIFAKKIIVATHFPFINKHGIYFLKMYQHRSYVIALKGAQGVRAMYVDESQKGLSFRKHGDLLLLGGGAHRTGDRGGLWNELRNFSKKHYPEASEVASWATQDCMTLDSMPYIGRYSKHTPDLYVATGFNKWGMTSSMLSATILADMVCDRKNEYEEIYSPERTILHPQLAVNMLEAVKGIITPTTPRCPHMGCALKYNKAEHSWDCPCHGSRFEENGKVINNPATDDAAL